MTRVKAKIVWQSMKGESDTTSHIELSMVDDDGEEIKHLGIFHVDEIEISEDFVEEYVRMRIERSKRERSKRWCK